MIAFARAALACAAIGIASPVFCQTQGRCPKLPPDVELKWMYSAGPDFDVCNAMRGDDQLFGIYLGNHPSFHPDAKKPSVKGKVGKHDVRWYDKPTEGSGKTIAKEALVTLGEFPDHQVAHVWVGAANAKELEKTFDILGRLVF